MERDAAATDATTEAPRPVKLIIAEDHEMARLGLRTMLAPEPDLMVVGEATTGRETLELCERLQPDLILMDIRMPDMDGLAATRAIKQEWPGIRVLIITMSEDPNYLLEALKVGASGHILKDASRREVIAAIRQVLAGELPLDPKLAAQLLKRLANGIEERAATRRVSAPGTELTPRELEVLRLVADGKTNAEIAHALFVSVGTVKIHVERIIDKLGASDRTQAAVRAFELGLLRSGDE